MAEVTIHGAEGAASAPAETPSQTVVRSGNEIARKADGNGRMIGVRRLKALQLFKLTELLGEGANVAATLNMAMMACSVVEIGGDAIAFPTSKRELEFLLQQLDFEGLNAATEAAAQFSVPEGFPAAKN
jgi:hypothetical protein